MLHDDLPGIHFSLSNLLRPAGVQLQPATFTLKLYRAEDIPRSLWWYLFIWYLNSVSNFQHKKALKLFIYLNGKQISYQYATILIFCVTNMQVFFMQSIINNFHSSEKELLAVWY